MRQHKVQDNCVYLWISYLIVQTFSFIKPEPGKNLRNALTRSWSHWDFWQKALITLNSMKYININKAIVPSITNWIKTIKGIMHICKQLLDCGFTFVLLRNFNQDPIENFFGSINSHGLMESGI